MVGDKWKQAEQEIYIGPLPKGVGRQEVYVNPPGGRPSEKGVSPSTPHYAGGTERLGLLALLLVVIIGAVTLIVACGVASALVTGSIW